MSRYHLRVQMNGKNTRYLITLPPYCRGSVQPLHQFMHCHPHLNARLHILEGHDVLGHYVSK